MDIKEELLKEHSRQQTMKIVAWIGNDADHFREVMHCFFSSRYQLAQRASWVVSLCVEQNPAMIHPYLKKMIRQLDKDVHDAVKRNALRILQYISIPEHLYGEITDSCFALLSAKNTPVAIKAFSMTVLGNICKEIPELKAELRMLIEDQLPYEKPAFISRARRVLKIIK